MTARGLALRHIEHVAEQATERRAQNVHDLQACVGRNAGNAARAPARRAIPHGQATGKCEAYRTQFAHVQSLKLAANR